MRSWFLLTCVIIANLVNFIIKITLSRARPDLYFLNHEFGFYWFKWGSLYWSFPSGHAVTAMSLAAGLGIVIPNYFFTFFGIAILVSISRVILYKHYLSDVMAGFYISMLVIGVLFEYLKKE